MTYGIMGLTVAKVSYLRQMRPGQLLRAAEWGRYRGPVRPGRRWIRPRLARYLYRTQPILFAP